MTLFHAIRVRMTFSGPSAYRMTTMEAVALELASAESVSSQSCVTGQASTVCRPVLWQSRAMVCPPCEHREGRRDPLRPGPNPAPALPP